METEFEKAWKLVEKDLEKLAEERRTLIASSNTNPDLDPKAWLKSIDSASSPSKVAAVQGRPSTPPPPPPPNAHEGSPSPPPPPQQHSSMDVDMQDDDAAHPHPPPHLPLDVDAAGDLGAEVGMGVGAGHAAEAGVMGKVSKIPQDTVYASQHSADMVVDAIDDSPNLVSDVVVYQNGVGVEGPLGGQADAPMGIGGDSNDPMAWLKDEAVRSPAAKLAAPSPAKSTSQLFAPGTGMGTKCLTVTSICHTRE